MFIHHHTFTTDTSLFFDHGHQLPAPSTRFYAGRMRQDMRSVSLSSQNAFGAIIPLTTGAIKRRFNQDTGQQKEPQVNSKLALTKNTALTEKMLAKLSQENATFTHPSVFLQLNMDKVKLVLLLTGQILQHEKQEIWQLLSQSEKSNKKYELLEMLSHYCQLSPDQYLKLEKYSARYLTLEQIEAYRLILVEDKAFTRDWIFDKEQLSPHILIKPQSQQFNCIAESLDIHDEWLWDDIAKPMREHFSLAEIEQFYGQYGYRVVQDGLHLSLPNSIFIFGHQHSSGMRLKHAGRTDDLGFYISKLGTAGSVLWASPESDECPEYGRPLVQLVKHK